MLLRFFGLGWRRWWRWRWWRRPPWQCNDSVNVDDDDDDEDEDEDDDYEEDDDDKEDEDYNEDDDDEDDDEHYIIDWFVFFGCTDLLMYWFTDFIDWFGRFHLFLCFDVGLIVILIVFWLGEDLIDLFIDWLGGGCWYMLLGVLVAVIKPYSWLPTWRPRESPARICAATAKQFLARGW